MTHTHTTPDGAARSARSGPAPHFRLAFLALFTLSGTAGLMYQVIWVRELTTVLGASAHAVAVVLAAFMSGLGLGAWFFGRLADRLGERGLARTYAAVEVAIAAWALCLPLLLALAQTALVSFHHATSPGPAAYTAVRLGLAFALLLAPASLIGATLPLLGRFLTRDPGAISLRISQLYAANTFGAILGALAAGYLLLPLWGLRAATWTAAGLNLLVAAGFLAGPGLARAARAAPVQREPAARRTPLSAAQWTAVAGFALSGLAAMCYEVAWTRALSMVVGTTTYAFTTMLATILTGIALGSWLYRFIPERVSRLRLFALVQLFIALAGLATIPALGKLPFVYLSLQAGWMDTWGLLQPVRFGLAAMIMLVPCTALGLLLPVVSSLFIERTGHLGRRLGLAYSLNTCGAAAGALLAGLLFIPWLGLQQTIVAAALGNAAAGLAVLALVPGGRKAGLGLASAVVAAAVFVVAVAPWSPKVLNSGVYVYAERYERMLERFQAAETEADLSDWQVWDLAMRQYDLLYHRAGSVATVAVMQRPDGVRFLTVDGKTDASTGHKSDMRTQVMIGQLPLLFHQDPDSVLVVGLGSGVTLGAALTHDVRVVDCVELSPAMVGAARHFADFNHNALDDPRLRLEVRDARNYLLTSGRRYDVVVSQPSNPWINGQSMLFSRDWYRLVRRSLHPGGLFAQWVPTYLMAEQDFKIVLHTLRQVFDHVTVWTSGSVGDMVIIASKDRPLRIDMKAYLDAASREPVARDILRVDLDPLSLPMDLFVMDDEKMGEYLYADLSRALPVNTDDHLVTEYSTPKELVRRKRVQRFLVPENLHAAPEEALEIIDGLEGLPDG